jgi:uncharacterized protein DUF4331
MSHHASGPNFGLPLGDARLDMTDLYAFPQPGQPDRSVLILNVHPSYAVNPRGPTTKEPFAPGALYEIKIDTDGDAIADITYSAQFAAGQGGRQTATLRRVRGARAAGVFDDAEIILDGAPVSVGREPLVVNAGEVRAFFGWRSDSFFNDANGIFQNMQFTGDDFFADKDVCSIVLELPNAALGSNPVGLWGRIVAKTDEGWIQADRGARPEQAVFLPGESRELYLQGEPAHDDRFVGAFAHELEHSGSYSHDDAIAVAKTLLPDILSYDPRCPASFPHNGRTLTDDVFDAFLAIYTNGKVTEDKAGPHRDLLDEFPYLGPPHESR